METILYNIQGDREIYRYLSFYQLVSLLENDRIYLTKISKWDDSYEDILRYLPVNGSHLRFEDFRNTGPYYGQSWSLDNNSDAMWRIYSKDGMGLMIKTKVNKLSNIQGIKIGLIGKIAYYNNEDFRKKVGDLFKDDPNDIKASTLKYPLLKRTAFEHEKEIRLITVYHEDYLEVAKYDNDDFISFEVNAQELIEEVIIDPRAPNWFVRTMTNYFKNKSLDIQVKKSNLYQVDTQIFGDMKVDFK